MSEDQISFKVGLDDSAVSHGIEKIKHEFLKLGAELAAAFALEEIIKVAAKAEVEVNKLNQALANTGRYSKENSEHFQELAEKLESVSLFSFEAVLGAESLAQRFAKTADGADKLTRAAVELSAATGIDLNTAITALGKTLSGQSRLIGVIDPQYKKLTESQLRSGEAINRVLNSLSGSAEQQTKTFAGSLTVLAHVFESLVRVVGDFIVKSPAIRGAINFITEQIEHLTSKLKTFAASEYLNAFLIRLVDIAIAINSVFVNPIILAFDVLKTGMQAAIFAIVGTASDVISFFAPNSEMAKNLAAFKESSGLVLKDFANETQESFKKAFDKSATDNAHEFLSELRDKMASTKDAAEDFKNKIKDTATDTSISFDNIKNAFISFSENFKITADDVAKTLRTSFVSGISSAFSALGKGLAVGKGGIEDLGKSVLNTLGALAIQMGQFFILIGAGMSATSELMGFKGGAAIAAGIALTVLGGFLQGIAGGSSASSGASAGGTGGEIGGGGTETIPEMTKKPTEILVSIEGNVLDPRGTGIAIKELLDTVFESNGSKLVSA